MKLSGPIDEREALRIYLQDHHAGAQGGIALAHRAAANHAGRPAGEALRRLVQDIEEDEAVLRRVMSHVGARPSPVKDLGAQVLERVGRLKTNGQLRGRSPLSSVIELEGLLSAVKSKQHVWMALRDATHELPAQVDAGRMIERADDQLARLHPLWGEATRTAFAGADRSPAT